MPRAIWSGSISFGLVNVPVRMFSAVEEHDLHFNLLHEPDSSRIGYQKICKAEGKPVPDDEIVKAFEVEKGEFVPLTDEDFAAAQEHGAKTIEIHDFVPYEEIDPVYFERTYYLGPQQGGEKVYTLLRDAMERAGLAAIATFVMRERQQLGCLRIREGVVTLVRMFFADEIRPPDGIGPKGVRIGKREQEMADSLIEQFAGTFAPEKYEDTYRKALRNVIRRKQKGEQITSPEQPEAEEPTDLLAALRASVDAAKSRKPAASKSGARRRAPARKQSRSTRRASKR